MEYLSRIDYREQLWYRFLGASPVGWDQRRFRPTAIRWNQRRLWPATFRWNQRRLWSAAFRWN